MNQVAGMIGNAVGADTCVPYSGGDGGGGGGGSCSIGTGNSFLDSGSNGGGRFYPQTGPCAPFDCGSGGYCMPGSFGSLPLPGQNVCYAPAFASSVPCPFWSP